MTDPLSILQQARWGPVPADWRVFAKRRGKLSGIFHGTSDDPDPLLVITPEVAVEYISERKPPTIVVFQTLVGMRLRVASSNSSAAVSTWVDLRYVDGNKAKWRSAGFANDLEAIQGFIEAYGAHKALRGYA
ncbi:hypothetical protein [Streptomyces sp. NPDC005303]|uniref:hypothetical protein n=1 Tax=Streptomyces sp. NPDC005303 TaxID=3155713 RepID=UPI0033AAABA6